MSSLKYNSLNFGYLYLIMPCERKNTRNQPAANSGLVESVQDVTPKRETKMIKQDTGRTQHDIQRNQGC